jgi:hypothetical protein
MTTKPKANELEWEITRIRGKAAVHVGYVHALDEKSAIAAAIKECKIVDPNDLKRLEARRR